MSLKLPRADVFQHHPRALEVCGYLAVLQRTTCSFDEGALVSLFSAKCCLRIFLVAILVHEIVIGQVEIIARLVDQAPPKFRPSPCSSMRSFMTRKFSRCWRRSLRFLAYAVQP
jgi:hypothetical protein